MLDGIRARRDTAFYPPTPTPKKQLVLPQISIPRPKIPAIRLPKIRIPVAVWVMALIFTAGGFLFQPAKQLLTAEASAIPTRSAIRSTELPIAFVQSTNQTQDADQTIVIDQPTSNSIAQPDTFSPVIANNEELVLPTVRVLNGGSTADKVKDVQSSLETGHYHILAVGSAQFTYVQTTIYYLAGNKDKARAVADAIGHADATLTEDPIAGPADVLVVLGNDTP